MTGIEIKQYAEAYLDETIDDPDALKAINRALNLMGDTALVYDVTTIDAEAKQTWCDLPADMMNVVAVENADGVTYADYDVRGNKIRFAKEGVYTVYYRRLPKPLKGIADTPEVHPAYHQCIITYLQGWWRIKDDDESPDGLKNEAMFKEDTSRVFNMLRRNNRGPSQVEVIRHA